MPMAIRIANPIAGTTHVFFFTKSTISVPPSLSLFAVVLSVFSRRHASGLVLVLNRNICLGRWANRLMAYIVRSANRHASSR